MLGAGGNRYGGQRNCIEGLTATNTGKVTASLSGMGSHRKGVARINDFTHGNNISQERCRKGTTLP
jgi:hypothetical protein